METFPDVVVENPFGRAQQARTAGLLQDLAEVLDREATWRDAAARAPSLGLKPVLVTHFGDELVSSLRAVSALCTHDALAASLIETTGYALTVARDRGLIAGGELDGIHKAILDAEVAAHHEREVLLRAEQAEIREHGWALRDLPPLPDPIATPACTFHRRPERLRYPPRVAVLALPQRKRD